MMSITTDVRTKMVESLKSGDKQSRQVYSSIANALDNKAKELLVDSLNSDQEIQVITKLMKQNQESIDTCPADRTDILDKLNFERSIIEVYMPKLMSKDEIYEVVKSVLNDLGIGTPTSKDKGKVMKELMPKIKGKADGKLVNTVVMEILNNG